MICSCAVIMPGLLRCCCELGAVFQFNMPLLPQSSRVAREDWGGGTVVRELCYVTEWSSRHDSNGHEKQIKNDYGRRAAGDERSVL